MIFNIEIILLVENLKFMQNSITKFLQARRPTVQYIYSREHP